MRLLARWWRPHPELQNIYPCRDAYAVLL